MRRPRRFVFSFFSLFPPRGLQPAKLSSLAHVPVFFAVCAATPAYVFFFGPGRGAERSRFFFSASLPL